MIGTQLSHFRITAKLGEGGMGEVYEAEDTELDRTVALKILPEHLGDDPQRLERFRREAKALAAIDHPNIVTIHGIEKAEGRRFLIMARVEGDSLDKLSKPGGVSLTRFFEIALPVADALAAAHEKGIIHRDLKPANVMSTRDGRIKLLDFGLARLMGETRGPAEPDDRTDSTALTGQGVVMGTIPYMSPEQLEGHKVDARTDIFSLGVLLYEMACGARPFQGDSGLALASSILNDTPPSLTDVRPELPEELGRLVRACLEKEPDRRIQTAKDVRNRLEVLQREVLSGEVRASAPKSSKKWVAAGAAALVVLALGGFYLGSRSGRSGSDTTVDVSSRRPVIVVLPFENLGEPDDEYFADGMTEEITSRLAGLDGLAVISRTSAMQYKESRPSARQIGEELGVDYVLEGTVRWQRASGGPSEVRVTPQLIRVPEDTHMWAERYDAVLADIFEVQSDIAQQVIARLDVELLDSERRSVEARPTENLEAYDFYLKGNDYFHRGRELESADEYLIAIEMYDKAIELDPSFAQAYANQSVTHSSLYDGFYDRTEARLDAAREAAEQALALEPELPAGHFALGTYFEMSDRERERAIEEFETVLQSQPRNADVFEAISDVQLDMGLWEESLVNMTKAIELNPRLGSLACWAGGRHMGLHNFDEALHMHERAIELTPDRACPYYCKALIHLNADASTETAREFLEALPENLNLEDTPPINYPWVQVDIMDGRYDDALARLSSGSSKFYNFRNIYVPKDLLAAQIYGLTDRPELSREHYESACDLLEAALLDLPDDARVHSALGVAYAGLGRKEDAIREGRLGLELLGGSQDYNFGWRIKDMAQIYLMVGEVDEALEEIERLISVPTFFSTGYVSIDPLWEPLRDDRRFQAILEKYR